jgi:S-adenosylmethionine hydrolase
MKIITLTTDFGDLDSYVGMMKGVIYTINPDARIVDLTHQIEPQNILQGAFQLFQAHRHFPPGTIHVGVVDPGVGTSRRAIAVYIPEIGYFVGPDNGLFSYILDTYPQAQARELNNPAFQRPDISNTFHGRDIFAPVAAYLSRGIPFEESGPLVDLVQLKRLENYWPVWQRSFNGRVVLRGKVVQVDRFGNIISNLSREHLAHLPPEIIKSCRIMVPDHIQASVFCNTYGEGLPGQFIALYGSSGFLEIAQVNERAAHVHTLINGVQIWQQIVKIGYPFEVELPYSAS